MSHIVPICRSHSSKAQYWQCGCLGDNSSNGSLYMVRRCIISFIVSLRRWIFKVLGTHSSVVVMYMEKVFWFLKMYLFTISVNNTSFNCSSTCIVKFLTWKIKWIIKKIQCSFVNNYWSKKTNSFNIPPTFIYIFFLFLTHWSTFVCILLLEGFLQLDCLRIFKLRIVCSQL